jgi:hypothetical protein
MINVLNVNLTIDQLKCNLTELLVLHSKRLLYGIECDLDKMIEDVLSIQRYIDILSSLSLCNLYGNIVDEINKYLNMIQQTYSLTC